MQKLRFLFIVLSVCSGISLLLIQACKKDNVAPVIELTSPFNGQDISTSDSILISGTLSDDVDLHELDIVVTNLNGDTVYYNSPYVHGLKANTFQSYFAPADTGTYLITATIYDHELAATTTSVIVYAHNAARLGLLMPYDGITINKTDSLNVAVFANDDKGMLYLTLTGINSRSGDTATEKSILLNNALNYATATYLAPNDTGIFDLNVSVVNHYNFVTTKRIRYYVQ